ncbi:MAG TPA: hypothetical protein VM597_12265 [Gemmataceae bacterium]|jgi:hypothetical protein|nr:hypothetical protein [Gemmataceae bacterium]
MKPTTDLALVILGLIAWLAAGFFAIANARDVPGGTGAACGFAIAGGLCLLGAALTSKEGNTPKPTKPAGPEADYRDPPG